MPNVARDHGLDRAGALGPPPVVPPWQRIVVRLLIALGVGVFVLGVLAIVGLYFALRQWGRGPDNVARAIPTVPRAEAFDATLRSSLAAGPVAPRQVATVGITVQAVTAAAGVGHVYYRATDGRQTLCLVDRVDLAVVPPTVVQHGRDCAAPLPRRQVEVLRPR